MTAWVMNTDVRLQYQDNTSTWTTITGNATELHIDRPHKSAGTLNATVYADSLNPYLHPSDTTHLRKGQKIRVQVLVSAVWKAIFTGTIGTVDTSPDFTAKPGRQYPITIQAHDAVKKRHQKMNSHGVGKVDDLRAYVDTPFKLNGATTTKSSTGVETFEHELTSEWDQINITADSEEGWAWVDKDDTLNVYDRATKSSSSKATLGTSNYTASDLGMNYTIESIINQVTVKAIKKYGNGKASVQTQVSLSDSASVINYGARRATYTIQGSTHNATTFANSILTNNADPALVPTSMVVPIRSTTDIASFADAIDLTDIVTINTPDAASYTARVDTIKHDFTPTSDGKFLSWTMAMTFVHPQLRVKPTIKPDTGYGNLSDKMVETASLDDKAATTAKIDDLAVTTAKLADGAVTAVKASATLLADIGGNKVSAGTVAPTSPTTGDIWIDTGNGNVLKRWSGSTWASVQDAAIATAQATANGKNTVTYSASTPGTTANTAGDIWFQTATGVVVGQWQGNGGTSWSSVTLGNLVIAALDAGKITTGTLSAARIATSSIDTTKLIISNVSNMVDDPGFELGSASWVGSGSIATIADPAVGGTKVYQVASNGTALAVNYLPTANGVLVNPGETYYFEIKVRKTTTGTTGSLQFVGGFTKDGTSGTTLTVGGSTITMASLTQNVWTTVSGQLTVPAGKDYVKAQAFVNANVPSGQTIQWDDVVIRKAGDANLIVDGAITASKIAAGSIDGMTITGAILQTASSGNRLKIYSTGTEGRIEHYAGISGENPGIIKAANSSGVPVLSINSGTATAYPNAAGIQLSATTVAPNGTIVLTGDVTVNNSINIGTLGSGSTINGLTHGSFSGSTNSSSQVTVNHGLTTTPTRVLVTSTGQNGQMKRVISRNSTSFVVEHRGTSGALVGNAVAVAFDWLAIA